jgi:hypothetical protein
MEDPLVPLLVHHDSLGSVDSLLKTSLCFGSKIEMAEIGTDLPSSWGGNI